MKLKHWLRFRLTTILIATALIAIVLAVLVPVNRHASLQHRKFLDLAGTPGVYDVCYENEHAINHRQLFSSLPPSRPKWLVNLLGDGYFYDISQFGLETSKDPNPLLVDACDIGKLRLIKIVNCEITPDSVETISQMKDLVWLNLAFSKIDDERFEQLAGMTQLKIIDLRGTNVSQNSIDVFSKFSSLEYLYLNQDRFDKSSLKSLQEAVPNCNILFEFKRWPELRNAK